MLPVETAIGHLFLSTQFLCDVKYDIGEPLPASREFTVQRIALEVPHDHHPIVLAAYNLILVLANKQRQRIPRPFQHSGLNYLECYVETY